MPRTRIQDNFGEKARLLDVFAAADLIGNESAPLPIHHSGHDEPGEQRNFPSYKQY